MHPSRTQSRLRRNETAALVAESVAKQGIAFMKEVIMTTRSKHTLMRLDDTGLTVADPNEDIRGHTVIDQHGEEIGKVDGLLLDPQERKVRMLEVAAGGFLGIGERTFIVPVDAVTSIAGDTIHIDRTRDHVAGAPAYDPTIAQEDEFWEGAYGYYGYTPYWGAGYAFPGIGTMVGVPTAVPREPREVREPR
jgi:sporulation protein YlmC with PRC-barrel domain